MKTIVKNSIKFIGVAIALPVLLTAVLLTIATIYLLLLPLIAIAKLSNKLHSLFLRL